MARIVAAILLFLVPVVMGAQPLDQNGKPHDWKGQADRITVIDFAAAWCVPCWGALPRLQTFADEHPEVAVLVVSVDDNVEGRDKLVEKLGLTVPVLWDENDEIAKLYRPDGMPATFVLNSKGEVIYSHVGSGKSDWNEMVEFVESLPEAHSATP